jgi:S1-C subfamily serine protease
MNPLDLAAIALIVVAAILGFRSGALPQIGGLLGALIGGAIAVVSLPWFANWLRDMDPTLRPLVVLGGLLLAVGLGESLGSAAGRALARALGGGVLSAADRVGGSIVGVAQAFLVLWLVGSLIAIGPLPGLAEVADDSTTVQTLAKILPPVTEVAGELGSLLDASGLPDVFVGFEPLPAPDVQRPADATARSIAAAAEASTLKVSAGACGVGSVGSGFVVARGYVVTNAHVVAGANADGIRVADSEGHTWDAVPVLFDPKLDVALLRVDGLDLPALRFTTVDPARGAVAATLGYPGGGPLTILPAAVTGRYPATGLDIYDRTRVRRDILELRAAIERGDSGGPLILEDGTVGGVVFAESRTNESVGYALSPTAVAVTIAPGVGRTSAVTTGACLR